MNKELALEQIDACILMLEQIKSSITGAGDGTPKRFWVDSDGVQHFDFFHLCVLLGVVCGVEIHEAAV